MPRAREEMEQRMNEVRKGKNCKDLTEEEARTENCVGAKFLWDQGYLLYCIKILIIVIYLIMYRVSMFSHIYLPNVLI
jgi:hypothetical protein